MLMLSVGSAALYFGIVRPEVSTTPKRLRDYFAEDPAQRPPIRLPPFVVSESRTDAPAVVSTEDRP